ncbi:LysR family transcriptional regulator [Micromonospora sp. NPDC049559]|uniref:LysR family transcriptional regulator n=1 Tax=Micromonospora sp. NPDC049559 TaxID=3155923 RepID=UPI0034392BAF
MELRQLRTFVAVVRAGTVTEAAGVLGLAPSSVSDQIRRLERSLAVPLFDRTPDGMRLTPAGEVLLRWARRLLDEAEQARREVTGARPAVRLGALETLVARLVPAVLARLARRRPELAVEVEPSGRRDELLRRVATGQLDAALLLDTGAALGALGFTAVLPPDELAFTDLDPVPLALVAAPTHPLAGARGVPWPRLADERWLLTPAGCSFRMAVDRLLGGIGDRVEVGHVEIARAWAAQGLGLALLPEFAVAGELAAGALRRIDPAEPAAPLALRLVWRADREAEPDVRELLYAASQPHPVLPEPAGGPHPVLPEPAGQPHPVPPGSIVGPISAPPGPGGGPRPAVAERAGTGAAVPAGW